MKLYIKQKLFSLADKYDVYDENQQPVYRVEGRLFSFGAKISFMDCSNRELYYIEQKIFRFLPEYHIYREGTPCAMVKSRFSLFTPRIQVDSDYGHFEIEGDFFGHEFTILEDGTPVAYISKKYFSFSDRYGIDVLKGNDPAFIATLTIAIDNCLHNGNRNQS